MAGRRSTLTNAADSLPGTGGGDPLRELFEACKTGDLAKVKALVNPKTVNARDTAGRKSTPLHFAAGEFPTERERFLLPLFCLSQLLCVSFFAPITDGAVFSASLFFSLVKYSYFSNHVGWQPRERERDRLISVRLVQLIVSSSCRLVVKRVIICSHFLRNRC